MISLPHRRRFLHLCATGLGSATLPTLAEGQRPASESEKSPAELITPEARTAIDRGLTFLTRKQVKSGKLAGAFGTSGYAAGTAVTGLGGLAFMCSGSVPGDGPYGSYVDACVDYLIRNTAESGYIAVPGGYDNMYGHGFATLFLSESYGVSQKPELGEKLKKAVALIVRCQNNQGAVSYTHLTLPTKRIV